VNSPHLASRYQHKSSQSLLSPTHAFLLENDLRVAEGGPSYERGQTGERPDTAHGEQKLDMLPFYDAFYVDRVCPRSAVCRSLPLSVSSRAMPELSNRQRTICYQNPEATRALHAGLKQAFSECPNQFNRERWNCSLGLAGRGQALQKRRMLKIRDIIGGNRDWQFSR